MNKENEWKELLNYVNEKLACHKYSLEVTEDDGTYGIEIIHESEAEEYASGYFEDELCDLINDAYGHVNEEIANGFFVITRVHRDDLVDAGFDVSGVDDDTMRELAKRMCNDYLEQLYWSSLKIIAECMGIPKKDED